MHHVDTFCGEKEEPHQEVPALSQLDCAEEVCICCLFGISFVSVAYAMMYIHLLTQHECSYAQDFHLWYREGNLYTTGGCVHVRELLHY